tara:strand:+ start:112 stop:531 length:420 start_codon:yes stop_codon:yes gene_type:complete
MALQWDVENIKEAWYLIPQSELDKEKKEKEENPNRVKLWAPTRREENGNTLQMKGELQTLIFLTMNVGMNEITKKNYRKFYNRLHFLENQLPSGAYLTYADKPMPYTLEMIKDLIGLKTNATNLTKAKFIKNATRHIEL